MPGVLFPGRVHRAELFTLLPGLGSFGTNKAQAVFAGVEYLENEPSSSRADLSPPASNRQVPDTLKITFPLMAVAAEGRYIGLAWKQDRDPRFCAVFDSPDRRFGSPGHVLGLLFPGSDGLNRDESSLIPYDTATLPANQPVTLDAVILGGTGNTIVPAVQQYVRLSGLPPVPSPGMTTADYLVLAARGWLDSQIREADRYRHAAPGFGSGPAADAALYLDYLAGCVADSALAAQLTTAAQRALLQVTPAHYNSTQVGHVRYPLPSLVYGAVADNAAQALAQGKSLLSHFQPDGSVIYHPPAGGTDYSRTHGSKEANGFAATYVQALLEQASFAGDRALIDTGLRYLRALGKFRDTVPRGAQTWEIPLHTADILASAYLVRAYLRGYELTGDRDFLDQARYWAWTGVPFICLTPPTAKPVGPYATIPVLGATGWVAPVWIGLPVQWCGLVYAEALQRLARYDATGPWEPMARGIAVSGIQQSYPLADADYHGLLPDSFNLRPQSRNGPAINPATTLAPALRALGQPALYDFRSFNGHGLRVHAAGEITDVVERTNGLRFTVSGWTSRPHWLLVNGFHHAPSVQLNGQSIDLSAPHEYHSTEGWLILRLEGRVKVRLLCPALPAVNLGRSPRI